MRGRARKFASMGPYNPMDDIINDMATIQNVRTAENTATRIAATKRNRQESLDHYGFEPTIWTDVEAVRVSDQQVRLAALGRLLTKYQGPLKAYLRIRFGWRPGVNRPPLDDWFQSFILQKVMLKGLIEKADRSRGRFRDLLKKALWNFAMQEYRAWRRQTGNQVEIGAEGEEVGGTEQHECPESEREWARRVLDDALVQLEDDCKRAQQQVIWTIFLRRRLFPLAGGEPAESLDETAAYLQRAFSEALDRQQISNLQKTAERKLNRCIRDVLAEYCPNAEDIEEELLAFIEILKGGVSLPTRLRPPQRAN
jgi:hypothetical protein